MRTTLSLNTPLGRVSVWLLAPMVNIGRTMDMFGMGHHGSITAGGKEQAPYGEPQILTKQVFVVLFVVHRKAYDNSRQH